MPRISSIAKGCAWGTVWSRGQTKFVKCDTPHGSRVGQFGWDGFALDPERPILVKRDSLDSESSTAGKFGYALMDEFADDIEERIEWAREKAVRRVRYPNAVETVAKFAYKAKRSPLPDTEIVIAAEGLAFATDGAWAAWCPAETPPRPEGQTPEAFDWWAAPFFEEARKLAGRSECPRWSAGGLWVGDDWALLSSRSAEARSRASAAHHLLPMCRGRVQGATPVHDPEGEAACVSASDGDTDAIVFDRRAWFDVERVAFLRSLGIEHFALTGEEGAKPADIWLAFEGHGITGILASLRPPSAWTPGEAP